MRVVNPGTEPVKVTVSGRAVGFGDNGQVTMGTGPDRRWQGLVDFPEGTLSIRAQAYLDTPITVRVPQNISPDLYFVGFLVTPVPTGAGNLKVTNQIGSFVTIDVPGPRVRKLAANLRVSGTLDVSGLVIGSVANGTLSIRNVGHAAVRYWGESDTTASPGGATPQQHRIEKSLLPVGRSRSVAVAGRPSWPISFVTMKIHIIYPGVTEAATEEVVLRRRILVIHPMALAVLTVLIGFGVARRLLRRRKRAPRHRHAKRSSRLDRL